MAGSLLQLSAALLTSTSIGLAQPVPADGPPVFNKRLQLADGRTFVSDGALAIDAAIAKPGDISKFVAIPGSVLDRFIQAPFSKEYPASDLSQQGNRYVLPDGLPLSARYVDYLRQHTTLRRLALRVSGDRSPVIVMLDGRAIAIVMPMAK